MLWESSFDQQEVQLEASWFHSRHISAFRAITSSEAMAFDCIAEISVDRANEMRAHPAKWTWNEMRAHPAKWTWNEMLLSIVFTNDGIRRKIQTWKIQVDCLSF
jgi:hypothetical protein